ncbi:MAG: M20/M25/M40 family metallo-hydrolase [Bacillati bacterium ANGP1]|uniref:M20/M25/M40 family metallo-hydrolase n=1 Tax=Candidatus Segetimicrobium genomatis TaxID=2569760 RepID=A0A537JVV3_9BACT|nr:MAG: M20/M25/M40 family metallo-hydrolase [Terrabacteria group bacterium ANGP1]
MSIERVRRHIDEHREEALDMLKDLVRQPSVSAQDKGVKECAQVLADLLRRLGIAAEILPTATQPIVFGEIVRDAAAYTLLCYGHYDVQPPEPLDLWQTPPFEPAVRDGRLYGRGTGDNKGQLIAHVLAAHAWLEAAGGPPINLKFVFEGEEESGSPSLAGFIRGQKSRLAADLVYISDGGLHPSGAPTISLGNRGILGLTLVARGADRDNHSGNKGGVAPNPVWMLVHLLSSMVDPTGRVLIEGFYDHVRPIGATEQRLLATMDYDPKAFAATMGLETLPMDGPTYWTRIMLEPYCNINGFLSGYVGPGSKTIIPSTAECRLDIRLVVDQTTADILTKVRRHVAKVDPRVQVLARGFGTMEASRTAPEHPAVGVIADAIRRCRGVAPAIDLASGGSLPNAVWPSVLGVDHIGVPYANADENNHSPNENLSLDRFYDGIHVSAEVFRALGDAAARGALPRRAAR